MPKQTIKDMIDERSEKKTEADGLMDAAEKEKRELTTDEADRVDTLIDQVGELSKDIDGWQKDKARREKLASQGEQINGFRSSGPPKPPQTMDASFKQQQAAPRFRDAKTGQEIRAYLPSERISTRDDASVGKMLCGLVTGNWAGAETEQRALQGTVSPSGGYLLTPELSGNIIDLARAKSVCFTAGCLTIAMGERDLLIARLATDPVAYWKGELSAVTESSHAFQQLTLSAESLVAATLVSEELLQDATNAPSLIEDAMSSAIALELDRTILRGVKGDVGGGPTPTGIRYTSDVHLTDLSGAFSSWDEIFAAMLLIENSNGTPRTLIMSPRENNVGRIFKDGDGHYLAPPLDIANLQKLVSTQIPVNLGGGSNESEIYIGDFSKVAIGLRTQIQIEAT